jgi:hypothetical protein
MTMATEFETPSVPRGPRVHDIGPGGVVVVSVEADDVRVRGVDGTEARVVAPADGAGIETRAEPGRFTVGTAGPPRGGFLGVRIGGHGFGIHVSGTVELEVPHDARVEVRSAAGDVALRDVRGGATVKTASGDVSVKRAGGRIAVSVASGDVNVTSAEPISLDVHSVSGDVRARAPQFERVAIETISGDAELAGAFGAAAGHVISTVSGSVELAVLGGLTVAVKTVSGSVECDHPGHREGDGRRRPLVIGDGAARLAVRTMSGDVDVRAGKPTTSDSTEADDAASARFGFPPAPQPPVPPRPPAPPAPGLPPSPAATEVTLAAPAAQAGAPGGTATTPDPTTLAVLEALARGDIDVTEAERRLAGAPPVAAVDDGTTGDAHDG